MKYIAHTHSIMVMPRSEPIYSEQATIISLDDEAAGPFITVAQHGHIDRVGKISITQEEWPALRKAIDEMIVLCGRIENEEDEQA